jgi:hypothetical protein
MIGPLSLRGLLTHGLYSQFAGMINGHSVASGWGDGKKVVTVITKTPTIATATTTNTVASATGDGMVTPLPKPWGGAMARFNK